MGGARGLGWCAAALLLATSCSEPTRGVAGAAGERPVFRDALWDDGEAEIASYRVVERRYGTLREGHATLIVVKESFDAAALVKADGPVAPEHPLEVMKLNHVLTTPTGVYTYRQMASVFVRRDDARPVKLVTSSQEWCGITSKRMEVRGPRATLHGSSYFGAEGDRAYPVVLDEDTVLFDALPMWLRTLELSRPGTREVRLVPAQLSHRVTPVEVAPATIEVGAPGSVEVPAGTFEAVPVTVEHAAGTEVFHLQAEAPHTLVRWARSDGGEYALEWVRRAPYWELHDPEHLGLFEAGAETEAEAGAATALPPTPSGEPEGEPGVDALEREGE